MTDNLGGIDIMKFLRTANTRTLVITFIVELLLLASLIVGYFSKYISNADTEYITNTDLSKEALKNVISNVSSTGFDFTLPNSETSISGTKVYDIRGIMIS